MSTFIHLHNHTEYSLLDGAATIKKLVAKAKASGAPAVAITDHGNLYGVIKFYEECLKAGIKPIIGCEFYIADDMHRHDGRLTDEFNRYRHLVLIAKNKTGYDNLAKLSSLSFLEGFHYKPRIDLNLLKEHSEGLICLSACLSGAIPKLLLLGDFNGALGYARTMKGMFAEGDFYIELQNHGLDDELRINPLLASIAKEIGVKCVATNDVHYVNKTDAEMHDILLCIQTGARVDDADRMRYPNDEFYYKTYDEMNALFGWCPESLETPFEIADKCDLTFTFKEYRLPSFPKCPEGMTANDYLRKLTFEGLERRYGTVTDALRERAESELEVIIGMNFSEYFLIVCDFIQYARRKDIPVGPGRGSGVGSIVAYSIGITDVEPLQFGLLFERFLNKRRKTMPDFDLDFCYNRRGEMIDYAKELYGENRVSQIITFGRLKKKAAIKDVARVFNLPFSDVTKLTKSIVFKLEENEKEPPLSELINEKNRHSIPALIEIYNDDANPAYRKVLDIAIQIEGMPRNTSVHAAGVVIYKDVALDSMPLAKNGNEITTQFDMVEVENLGFLKMDFLALMTLTDIKSAHDYIERTTGENIDFDILGYNDADVYSMIAAGNTDAVFQLEGGGMKNFMNSFKPKKFEDIIAGISIYRPGPMKNIDKFLGNLKNPEKIEYPHPLLVPILEPTGGIIIYQEQAMQILRVLAGYDLYRADEFRAIVSKKKKELIPEQREMFIHGKTDENGNVLVKGCLGNGISEEVAISIFQDIESFASYAFNKSHAAAYAVVAYQTAYYKRYYPTEYMAAVLNDRIGKPDDTKKYIHVLKDMNIPLLQPDINSSEVGFSCENGSIRYGLSCIKNVGKSIEDIIAERETNGKFKDFYDFLERSWKYMPNRKMLESMIKGGALDSLGLNRATLIYNYEPILNLLDQKQKRADSNQIDFFSLLGEDDSKDYAYVIRSEYQLREKFADEKEMLGMYLTGHPLENYKKDFEALSFNTSMLPKSGGETEEDEDGAEGDTNIQASNLYDGMEVEMGGIISEVTLKKTKDGKEMGILVIEDLYDRVELVAFNRIWMAKKRIMEKDALVRIKARLSIRDGVYKLSMNDILPWELSESDDYQEETVDNRILYLNIKDELHGKLDRIFKILEAYPGKNAVRIKIDGGTHELGLKIRNPDLVATEIAGIIGSPNIKII